MLVTRLRNTRVRLRLVRKGVLICVGSKPLVATSTSIGVNSHEFVSLIRVKETVGSPRNCFSRCSAVVTPANPPPRVWRQLLADKLFILKIGGKSSAT